MICHRYELHLSANDFLQRHIATFKHNESETLSSIICCCPTATACSFEDQIFQGKHLCPSLRLKYSVLEKINITIEKDVSILWYPLDEIVFSEVRSK